MTSTIERAQTLARIAIESAAMCKELMREAFPFGEAVAMTDTFGLLVDWGPEEPVGEVNVLFENGNVWSKSPDQITLVKWSDVHERYKKMFATTRRDIRRLR